MKRCFVISPIGQEGSETRVHADDVFDFIIKPAMDECGILAWRSDHLHEPGKISEQMFRALLQDDLSVALLTGFNPNVFYELAIAQCAARPVIILAEKGQELPFDIRDLRCVYYDLSPRPLFEKTYVKQIISHVRGIEAADWKATSPVSSVFSQDDAAAGKVRSKFFEKTADYLSHEALLKLLQETENSLDVMGMIPDKRYRTEPFREVLIRKAEAGCKIRFLLMDQENPALPQYVNRAILARKYESFAEHLEYITQYLSELAEQTTGIEVRRIKTGCPHFRLTRTDAAAVYIPYLYSEKSDRTPLWLCDADSPIYSIAKQEFESLWQANN